MMLTLRHVIAALAAAAAEPLQPISDREVTGVTIDSRIVAPGNLFVALSGERTDGHLFIAAALSAGASAVIAESRCLAQDLPATLVRPDGAVVPQHAGEPPSLPVVFIVPDSLTALQELARHWRRSMPVTAVAITGSVGKTTTKETVANVLSQHYVTLRSAGNLNNEIGLPLTLLQLTPSHQRVVLEMGMYALGEIARLCELAQPKIGVVTNVGPVHLERLGSIERIAQAKGELPQALPEAADGGVAILNADDPLVRAMAGITRARVLTYGLNPEADLWADEIESAGLEGIRFRLHSAGQSFHVRLPLLGRHSVHTALRGAAVGLAEGMRWPEILAGLLDERNQLRLMVVPGLRNTTLIDDTYNASPDSVLAALNLLAEIANAKHRPVAVLGEMLELGSFEEEGHRVVGGRAAQVAAKLITVGRRSRWTADEALKCGMHAADVHPVENNGDAVALLRGLMRTGDIVLIKGSRAMEMGSIVDALSSAQPAPPRHS